MIIHIELGGYDPHSGMKAWKNLRKLGSIRIQPGDILGPLDEIRTRPAHCAKLKKRLQANGSSNSRGVKLVVINQSLETTWLTAGDQERKIKGMHFTSLS
jgi:hypothetical protein